MDERVVSADASRLRQVFENLLSNAMKVQPEAEPVLIVLDAFDGWASVSIADRGPGIAAEMFLYLFDQFSAGSGSVGLGLGLYLARGIVDAHGGSLEVDSHSGGGARLIIRLPLELGYIDTPLAPTFASVAAAHNWWRRATALTLPLQCDASREQERNRSTDAMCGVCPTGLPSPGLRLAARGRLPAMGVA